MKILDYDEEEINKPFTKKELENTINKLVMKKCPGPDGIGNEIIIKAGNNLRDSILKMINWFWDKEEVPDQLKEIDIKTM